MDGQFHSAARVKQLFLLAVLLLSFLVPMTTATARCYHPGTIASRFEEQLREEQTLTAKTAYTGVSGPGQKVQIGLFRWYDPNLQRWINRDPFGDRGSAASTQVGNFLPSDPIEFWDQPNLYTFVYNDPVDEADAYGLYTWGEWGGIIGSGIGGAGQGILAEIDGAWPFGNPLSGFYDSSDPAFKGSRIAGGVAVCALSGAGALKAAGVSSRIALHGPHHSFGSLGRLPHLQVNWWRAGVKGSGGAIRIPVPPGTPGFPK